MAKIVVRVGGQDVGYLDQYSAFALSLLSQKQGSSIGKFIGFMVRRELEAQGGAFIHVYEADQAFQTLESFDREEDDDE